MTDRETEVTELDALPPIEQPHAGDRAAESLAAESNPEWGALLEFLLTERGFDFRGYKPASLARRVRKRLEAVGVRSFGAYQQYLQDHSGEFATLFNTILINVTSFFRDPAAWEAVRAKSLPAILAGRSPDEPIRAWSAGCASGEEAYTIAIILAEALGVDGFQRRVKIYATDVDDEALNAGRHAAYTERHVEGVTPELLTRYFERIDSTYTIRKDLRRQVIFGLHDLINDAPISRVDLLTCRNTLMYLSAETQARVLSRFHFALNEGGFLLLGRAETLMANTKSFVTIDPKTRLSQKATVRFPRNQSPVARSLPGGTDTRLPATALENSPVAQLVVDSAGELALANERARELFELRRDDVGRPFRDLQLSYRPLELGSLINQVESERRPVQVKDVEWQGRGGELFWLDAKISPLVDEGGVLVGTILTFNDATTYRQLQRELQQSQQKLETAYLELQSTNDQLQTLNHELRQRGQDLTTSNAYLESVLSGLQRGVAVVDSEFRILAWNRKALELWGLTEEELGGKDLLHLDIGLLLEQLRPLLRSCMNGEADSQVVTLDTVNGRGKVFRGQVTCTPLTTGSDGVRGAILLMEDSDVGKS